MFWTVLHDLRSPENAGMIVRSHVAFGGRDVIFVGEEPWRFKRRFTAFSRRLERLCDIRFCADDDVFFAWCEASSVTPIAVEIAEHPVLPSQLAFPDRTAIVVGNEGAGLSPEFRARCAATVTIPQFGPVASLNVAVSASIVMYELTRARPLTRRIVGDAYAVDAPGDASRLESSASLIDDGARARGGPT